jgi:CII-binding regulator of phage lambda lysogenization HflD
LYEDDQECSVCKEIETYVDTISNQEDTIYEIEETKNLEILDLEDKLEDSEKEIKELKKEIETISHDNEIAQHRIGILEEELADSL